MQFSVRRCETILVEGRRSGCGGMSSAIGARPLPAMSQRRTAGIREACPCAPPHRSVARRGHSVGSVVPYVLCPLVHRSVRAALASQPCGFALSSKIRLHIRHATHCRSACSSHAMRKRGWASKQCPQLAHVTTWIQKACSKVSSTPCSSRLCRTWRDAIQPHLLSASWLD